MSNSQFAAPQQPATLTGDRLHSVPVVSTRNQKALPCACSLLRNPLQSGIPKAEPAVPVFLCGPGAVPRWCLGASVGISSLMERVRGKKRDAGFSSHFLCPENDCGRKEATPALAGEAVLGFACCSFSPTPARFTNSWI